MADDMAEDVAREFTLDEARALMPEVMQRSELIVRLRADLAELSLVLNAGSDEAGGIPEAKALEAHLNEVLSWFVNQGIEVKGIAPFLIDFPATLDGNSVRLCWLEGEPELSWYHLSPLGFPGRRRIS
jgi:hypothetical protein